MSIVFDMAKQPTPDALIRDLAAFADDLRRLLRDRLSAGDDAARLYGVLLVDGNDVDVACLDAKTMAGLADTVSDDGGSIARTLMATPYEPGLLRVLVIHEDGVARCRIPVGIAQGDA
jgi:hypothetical protein